MILHKVTFGKITAETRDQAEDIAESYIAVLLHNGQACGEYFTVVHNAALCCYVHLQGSHALETKNHCKYGIERLKEVVDFFRTPPVVDPIDDDIPNIDANWTNAPSLYLSTSMINWGSPLHRGDNGQTIPIYRLAGEHQEREAIYSWQCTYRDYDSIWLGCGPLEINTYKQLASIDSELSKEGREICAKIETQTGVPTYYFLMRYWGRQNNEAQRPCPGCGQAWHKNLADHKSSNFWDFPFRCEPCRLVSHLASSDDDEPHAAIGEWSR
ncbi:MAG: DUF2310 family Zn-ribbon-containing protein [Opitutaceae bacterium]